MGPLYKLGHFDYLYGLQLALLLGFFFGFLLERAGFASPRKLTAVFYLRDFAVLKVMFTAIVVAMLGLIYFSSLGWIDLTRVYLLPTYIWPHILGGFLLGVGFVMGGYCPTTSVVAAVSGKLDGLVFILGMMAGVLVFGEAFPLFSGFYVSGAMGKIRLSDVLHLSPGTVAFLVCLFAVGAFWLAHRLERKFGGEEPPPVVSRRFKISAAAALVALGFVIMLISPDAPAQKSRARVEAPEPSEETPAPAKEEAPEAESKPKPKIPGGFKIIGDEGC